MFGNLFGGSNWAGIFGTLANIYGSYKSYESQKDAAKIQKEASHEQVRAAGYQEQMAGEQEMAAMEAQRLAELNAVDAEVQNAREQENMRLAQAAEQGEARARAAASGVELSGSTGNFLERKKETAGKKLGWLEDVGESKVSKIRSEGEAAKQQGLAQAMGTRAGAAGTRAQAAGTLAGSKMTKTGAYGSALSGLNNIFSIGTKNKWWS